MTASAAGIAGTTLRPVVAEDVPAIVRLYGAVFRRPVTEAWYRWKVLDSPRAAGVPAAWVATRGERVLAHYGATGLSFRLEGAALPALHGCDLMAAAECRGQGVFGALARAAHAGWAAHGIAFIIGLPTGSWGPLRERLGCRTALPLRWLWKPLRATAWLPRRWLRAPRTDSPAAAPVHADVGGSMVVTPLAGCEHELDGLWRSVAPHYDALVVRDRSWIEYRYSACPGADHVLLLARRGDQAVGWLALRLVRSDGRTTGIVADLFTAPADGTAQRVLLDAAAARARHAGADDLRAYAAPGSALHAGLRRARFHRRAGGFESVVIPLARDIPVPLLNDPARWCLAGGDFDVV